MLILNTFQVKNHNIKASKNFNLNIINKFKTNKKGLFFIGTQIDTGLIAFVFVTFIFQSRSPIEAAYSRSSFNFDKTAFSLSSIKRYI
jgi:hypothetical protein